MRGKAKSFHHVTQEMHDYESVHHSSLRHGTQATLPMVGQAASSAKQDEEKSYGTPLIIPSPLIDEPAGSPNRLASLNERLV